MRHRLLLMLTGWLLALSAGAQPDHATTLDEAVSQARDRYNGRVLSAETERRDGRESHKIRILTRDGRVRRLRIDAGDGRPDGRRQR